MPSNPHLPPSDLKTLTFAPETSPTAPQKQATALDTPTSTLETPPSELEALTSKHGTPTSKPEAPTTAPQKQATKHETSSSEHETPSSGSEIYQLLNQNGASWLWDYPSRNSAVATTDLTGMEILMLVVNKLQRMRSDGGIALIARKLLLLARSRFPRG